MARGIHPPEEEVGDRLAARADRIPGFEDARNRIAAARIDERGSAAGEHALVGMAADENDAPDLRSEWQQIAVILEQHSALLRVGLAHRFVRGLIDRRAR